MIPPSSLTAELRAEIQQLGFEHVRFCPATGAPGIERYREMLSTGRHGSMAWMERSLPPREDPSLLLSGLESAIVLGTNYAWPIPPDPGGLTGQVSLYAWGRDYHNLIGKRLRKLVRWIRSKEINAYAGVDSRPIIERAWASRSGMGFAGKNCCTIQPSRGSFMFLSVVLVQCELPYDAPLADGLERYCGTCTKCLDACPTEAFLEPGVIDANRCISYLNIEHRGAIPEPLRSPMGRWVFGCDACQTVCPHNHSPLHESHPDLAPRSGHAWLDLEWVLSSDDDELDRHFQGSPIRRCRPEGLKRNAAIVLGNIGDSAGRSALLRASEHSSEVVREAATWALDRL
jgi:epoxyqueuosine reductase